MQGELLRVESEGQFLRTEDLQHHGRPKVYIACPETQDLDSHVADVTNLEGSGERQVDVPQSDRCVHDKLRPMDFVRDEGVERESRTVVAEVVSHQPRQELHPTIPGEIDVVAVPWQLRRGHGPLRCCGHEFAGVAGDVTEHLTAQILQSEVQLVACYSGQHIEGTQDALHHPLDILPRSAEKVELRDYDLRFFDAVGSWMELGWHPQVLSGGLVSVGEHGH
mmetsp:Transcript_106008/g.304828  ORF Transcript_106008/g.304828 Transcript_106008/m.304828 type:complete len:222 (+) Transcript_106008:909-1574(+)